MKSDNTVLKSWKALCGLYQNLEVNFLTLFTLITGALIIIEVVIRAMGMQGFRWMEELGRFMLVTTTLIGCSNAVRTSGHMVMDALYNVLPKRAANSLRAFSHLFCCGLYLYLGWYALQWTIKLKQIGKMMESIRFPSYVMWIFVSVALITMGFRYLIQFGHSAAKAIKDDASDLTETEAEIEKAFGEGEN